MSRATEAEAAEARYANLLNSPEMSAYPDQRTHEQALALEAARGERDRAQWALDVERAAQAPTHAGAEQALKALGVVGLGADFILDAGTSRRHDSRVLAAARAAVAAVSPTHLDLTETSPVVGEASLELLLNPGYLSPYLRGLAVGVLLLDMVGVGGRLGAEGIGTSRHPALRGLGKGRRQASDGSAYDAAIVCAVTALSEGLGPVRVGFRLKGALDFYLGKTGVELAVFFKDTLDEAPGVYPVRGFALEGQPLVWACALARVILLRATGLGPQRPDLEEVVQWASNSQDLQAASLVLEREVLDMADFERELKEAQQALDTTLAEPESGELEARVAARTRLAQAQGPIRLNHLEKP